MGEPLVCARCSTSITPGTEADVTGRAVHLRCLANAEELIDAVRVAQATCPACGKPLGTSRGVLFQDDQLVHAACWRAGPKPFDEPPPAG